jgi:phosphoribosyl-AMP cyclohydrolase
MLKELRIDCDADTLLVKVDQTGPACHTGRRQCFYKVVEGGNVVIDSEPLIDLKELYGK